MYMSTFSEHFSPEETSLLLDKPFLALKRDNETFQLLKKLWEFNFNSIGFSHIVDSMFSAIAESEGHDKSMIAENINLILTDKDFKRYARRSRRFSPKMNYQYNLIKNYLKNCKSILDFGCGKMALLRRIARENLEIENLFGYDPGSRPDYIDFDSRVKFFESLDEVTNVGSIDIVYCSFVFHHLTPDGIEQSLSVIYDVLKTGGKFIFLEESFPENKNSFLRYSIETNMELTEEFNKLPVKKKFLAIYVNDVLCNLKNLSYMPWTMEYKSTDEWARIITGRGFRTEKELFLGITESGRLKQGITSLQIFTKA
jgi:SAM-dependent methyltransferase